MDELYKAITKIGSKIGLVALIVVGIIVAISKIEKENTPWIASASVALVLLALVVIFSNKVGDASSGDDASVALTSAQWFVEIRDQLERCQGALVYLQCLSHPDEFKGEHRDELIRINNIFAQKIAEQPENFRMIGTATAEAGKPQAIAWFRENIKARFPRVDAEKNLAMCLKINEYRQATNSATMYLVADHLLFFRRVNDSNKAVYCRMNLNRTILAKLIKTGFLAEFGGSGK